VEGRCEQLSNLLERWAFLDILGHVGRLTILIAVIAYFMEADERRMQAENQRKAKHYQAWQVINAAQGKRGSGGRIDALQELVEDRVRLNGVDVSNAYLSQIEIENASLYDANLSGASLYNANLSGAQLLNANLSRANLVAANLQYADLSRSNLSGAELVNANLSGANLEGANLLNIRFWQRVKSIEFANIYGVKNPPDGFIKWAKERGAVSIEDTEERKKYLKYLLKQWQGRLK
jgi:hypothetical protein